MKVLIGEFITESNENIPRKNEITAYDIAFGEECVRKMHVGDIFAQAGIEVIPAVYAVSGASGVIKRHTFDYIEACFIRTVEEHLNEIDGIYMMLHGASEVEGLGSGEHHILAEVRKRVGPMCRSTLLATLTATCARNMWRVHRWCAAIVSRPIPTASRPGGSWLGCSAKR